MSSKAASAPGKPSKSRFPQRDRFKDWLAQAQRNLELSEIALKEGYFETAISLSLEAAEKSLKGVAYLMGQEPGSIRHSPDQLVALLPDPLLLQELRDICNGMENLYFRTRYPDMHGSKFPGSMQLMLIHRLIRSINIHKEKGITKREMPL